MSSCELPVLDQARQAALLRCAAIGIKQAVLGHTLHTPDLGDEATWAVDGVFVSLHRAAELRSCCGIVDGPHLLGKALDRAAWRAACDDPRFSPITPEELVDLHLEVHLLHRWQRCPLPAQQRAAALIIGRHGLCLRRSPAVGLLLPSVAREQGWDAATFLAQACRKAGLPLESWQQKDVGLDLFEAVEMRAALADLFA